MIYSIAVVGAGPIGAAATYHLARAGVAGVALVGGRDPGPAAYRQSGGCICWHRRDPQLSADIEETANFVRNAVRAGAEIRVRETSYLFLNTGVAVPALNIAAPDLVRHLSGRALEAGAAGVDVGTVTAVDRHPGGYRVVGDGGTVTARSVLLCLGTGNLGVAAGLVPGLLPQLEKRQLFVLDLPVDADRAGLPHVIVPFNGGHVYLFVKEVDGRLRLTLGQEDALEEELPGEDGAEHDGPGHDGPEHDGAVDQLPALLAAGLAERLPFLAGARTERILCGVDWSAKKLTVHSDGAGLTTLNCGSAVRSCVALGRRGARVALDALADQAGQADRAGHAGQAGQAIPAARSEAFATRNWSSLSPRRQ
jgi:glycine/D-amino acid oxidase-like deaminating enzyme